MNMHWFHYKNSWDPWDSNPRSTLGAQTLGSAQVNYSFFCPEYRKTVEENVVAKECSYPLQKSDLRYLQQVTSQPRLKIIDLT